MNFYTITSFRRSNNHFPRQQCTFKKIIETKIDIDSYFKRDSYLKVLLITDTNYGQISDFYKLFLIYIGN
uniref:Uncharacterized protein n=1 Tax=Strongyloides venezuelensis TaxID=75913 RepID=A0A0K0F0A2_STRVS